MVATRCSTVAAAAFMMFAAASAAAQTRGAQPSAHSNGDAATIERGRYLVRIMGCNDCHTTGFAANGGKVDERHWLTGNTLGFNGPWGTTYASNLRLYFDKLSEDEWVRAGRTLETRPPMPWFNVRAMSDDDLRAMHRYVRSLGPAGKPAPQALPPGRVPQGPTVRYPQP